MPRRKGISLPEQAVICLLLALATGGCDLPYRPHPRSDLPYPPPETVRWIWSGALTTSAAVIKAELTLPGEEPALMVFPVDEPERVFSFPPAAWEPSSSFVTFRVQGLSEDTQYRYVVAIGEQRESARIGFFKTLAARPRNFKIAFGSCAATGSNGKIFETIRALQPLFFLHLGDFHYANIRATERGPYLRAYAHVLASPAQSALYRSVPIAYVWDDHDYGSDNSDRTHPGRAASAEAYRLVVPHYPLASGPDDPAIYQAFSIGGVRFVLTDSRSQRDPPGLQGIRSLLGATQKMWFKEEIRSSALDHDLVVWINTVPWISAGDGNDDWGSFREERNELAAFLDSDGLPPVIMLSGDAHMLAIDDGSNSRYGGSRRGIPLFHAAALDRPGSIKGGPYSHGAIAGGGFFGLMEFSETETEFVVDWSGRDWQNRELLSHQIRIQK